MNCRKQGKKDQEKQLRNEIEKMVKEHAQFVVEALLKNHFWLHGLQTRTFYQRLGDDTDGGFSCMQVAFGEDADGSL